MSNEENVSSKCTNQSRMDRGKEKIKEEKVGRIPVIKIRLPPKKSQVYSSFH